MRQISSALVLVFVVAAALSFGSVAAGSSRASRGDHVVMSVTGSAPKGATVLYGRFAASYRGKFPFHTKLPVFQDAYSYFVSGTLKHGGKITCKIKIGTATKVGHAKGRHKTCTARLTSDGSGGWH